MDRNINCINILELGQCFVVEDKQVNYILCFQFNVNCYGNILSKIRYIISFISICYENLNKLFGCFGFYIKLVYFKVFVIKIN